MPTADACLALARNVLLGRLRDPESARVEVLLHSAGPLTRSSLSGDDGGREDGEADRDDQMIEGASPSNWQELQDITAKILSECGLKAQIEVEICLARGTVNVDVLATDPTATPPTTHICECKNWKRAVSKEVVHSFRTVVGDAGAHRGFIISSAGFQRGAYEAAKYSNVDLVDWQTFQELFAERWFRAFMAPALLQEGDALHEYTEPINSRIMRKADALPTGSQDRFRQLRERYASPSSVLLMLWSDFLGPPKVPSLPLRSSLTPTALADLPADILDALALRPVMGSVTQFYRQATAEFDEVFGERA
jgi:restriction system protein